MGLLTGSFHSSELHAIGDSVAVRHRPLHFERRIDLLKHLRRNKSSPKADAPVQPRHIHECVAVHYIETGVSVAASEYIAAVAYTGWRIITPKL
eukprot:400548-Prorocentrum_minimum.AAC.10